MAGVKRRGKGKKNYIRGTLGTNLELKSHVNLFSANSSSVRITCLCFNLTLLFKTQEVRVIRVVPSLFLGSGEEELDNSGEARCARYVCYKLLRSR